jgi:hypothetical protein
LGSRIFQLAPLNSATIGLHLGIECRRRSARRGCARIESLMTEELTRKIVAWATEIASDAAELPSSRTRDAYLAERRRELIAGAVAEGARQQDAVILADACAGAARRIMTELLAQRAGVPRGRV